MSLLRDAIRGLRAAPIVSASAILSLALGIGATTAMFSILDALLLRNLPVREPHRLVQLSMGADQTSLTNPIWEQVRDRQAALFGGAAAWGTTRFDLAQGGQTDLVNGLFTSGNFFDVLGVPAVRGRNYSAEDDARGGGPNGPVAVISHSFWQRHFRGADDAVGRSIALQRVTFTIVGIAPAGFTGPDVGRSFDVAVPLGTEPLIRGRDSSLDQRSSWWLMVVARLRQGQSAADAATGLNAAHTQIREATLPADWRPEELKYYLDEPFELRPAGAGTSFLRARYTRPLQTLMGVVSLVLLIACANIANLLLARAAARTREFSVRLALGASRLRLARQLFAESLLIASLGAAAGLVLALWGSRLLVGQLSTQVNTVFLDVGLDWRMLAFTASVAVATAMLFGMAPAWRAGKSSAGDVLTAQSRGPAGDAHGRVASTLVVAQVALSLVLVVAAGLFLRTFASLASRELGFERAGLLVANVNAQRSAVDPAARGGHFERIRQEIAASPGITAVAASVVTPVSGSTWQYQIEVPDRPDLPAADRGAHVNLVSPDWFRTYGTGIVAGRDFAVSDAGGAPDVAIVNRALAAKVFGESNPIGRTIVQPGRPGQPARFMEIVGVAEDAVYRSLRDPAPPTLYMPLLQNPQSMTFVSYTVRGASGAPAALSRAVADIVGRADGDVSVTFRALDDQVNAALVQERLLAMLSGFFGTLALLLSGVGLYGVTAYAVSRRRVEMGIRMALGATPGSVVGLVLMRAGLLVTSGVAAGALVSYWAASFVAALTFGVEARDLATFSGAAAVLIAIGVVAALLPARRASRIDPARVLREG